MADKISWSAKLRRWWRDQQWFFIGGITLAGMILGFIGFKRYFAAIGAARSSLDILYLVLQLFTLESGAVTGPVGWELQVARLLSPSIAAIAALKAMAIIFRDQLQMLKIGFIKNHTIICGLGKKGLLIAEGFIDEGHQVVVIELDDGNDQISRCREKGAMVLIGDATDGHLLMKAGIGRAAILISVCGDDGVNTEIAVKCRSLIRKRHKRSLTCISHIVNPRLSQLLKEQEIILDSHNSFRLEYFNIFDRGARACLNDHPAFCHSGKLNEESPHLLIVGMGRFGMSLVVQAVKNYGESEPRNSRPLQISILDRDAEQKIQSLQTEYPPLKNLSTFTSLEMEIHSPEFQKTDFLFDSRRKCTVTSIYICLDNDSLGLSTALTLHQRLRHHNIPIVVRMAHRAGLATLLADHESGKSAFHNLHAFGLLDRTCTPAILLTGTHEILAQTIHEEYVRKEREKGQTLQTNPSLLPWSTLPESLKESNRSQANHICVKLDRLGCGIERLTDWESPLFQFSDEEIESMAQLEHKRWVEDRRSKGWKFKSGPKNIRKKTTPYLVPWEELTEEVKELDRNTVRDLPKLLAIAGFRIYRLAKKT